MRALLLFLLVFTGALFAGALVSYPLHVLISLFTDHEFSDLVIRATQLCGFGFSLLYLKYTCTLSFTSIGLKPVPSRLFAQIACSFLAGLLILGILGSGLMLSDIYNLHSYREINPASVAGVMISAILTGLAVALFEETVFRGALLPALAHRTSPLVALMTISLIYAAVHFIDYRDPPPSEAVGWLTAPGQFLSAYSGLITTDNIDAFLCLFILGLLLGLVRLRTNSIYQCIGLHAGLVAGVKLFRFFTEYNPDNSYSFLVSTYDYRLGYLALVLLTAVTITYVFRNSGKLQAALSVAKVTDQ